MRNSYKPMPQLYIMRAYHLYEERAQLKMRHLQDDAKGGFILHGLRENGKGLVPFTAISAGKPSAKYIPGASLSYTVDTGNGYRCYNYRVEVLGVVEIDGEGNRKNVVGDVPDVDAKVNGFVFK